MQRDTGRGRLGRGITTHALCGTIASVVMLAPLRVDPLPGDADAWVRFYAEQAGTLFMFWSAAGLLAVAVVVTFRSIKQAFGKSA